MRTTRRRRAGAVAAAALLAMLTAGCTSPPVSTSPTQSHSQSREATPSGTSRSSSAGASPSVTSSAALRALGRRTRYVALGDSYASGPLIPPQTDHRCLRSGDDYAGLLARAMAARSFRDVTCAGATTAVLTGRQDGSIAPQLDALSSDTTLVTVGIGGNDLNLVGLAASCVSFVLPRAGDTCAARDGDTYARRIAAFAPTYRTVVDEIRARAPQARVLLVGYPTVIRPGGCFPTQPMAPAAATYVQRTVDELNAAMAGQARRAGATYVDLATPSRGHDACAATGQRWLEGVVPSGDAFPLHPNILEMRDTERVLAALLTR